jgi:hypothetical protein
MNVGTFRVQFLPQISKDGRNRAHRYLASMLIQDFDKPTHVGALEFVWQVDRHFQDRHGVLLLVIAVENNNRVSQPRHSDSIQRHLTFITSTLDIFHQFSSSPA